MISGQEHYQPMYQLLHVVHLNRSVLPSRNGQRRERRGADGGRCRSLNVVFPRRVGYEPVRVLRDGVGNSKPFRSFSGNCIW